MAEALDEPLVVVGLDERRHELTKFVDVGAKPGPQALFLEGPDEAFGHAVALGLTALSVRLT